MTETKQELRHGDKVEYRTSSQDTWKMGLVYAITRDGTVMVYVGGSIIVCHPDNVRRAV